MSGRVRPARPLAPIFVAIGILAIWWLVAHNGGAGWVQALGDIVFGTFAVGIFGPAVVLTRARVGFDSAPADGTAGQPVAINMTSSTRLRVRVPELGEHESFVGPVGRRPSTAGEVVLLPQRHGVLGAVSLDLATSAPFALQWWTRRVVLALPSPLHIAPRLGPAMTPPPQGHDDAGESTEWAPADVGQPRGARPYRPGDGRRQVHWRSTAHTGELMVRELERDMAEHVTLSVELPAEPVEAERVAERALGTLVFLLDRGVPVLLATTETTGPVLGAVADRREAGRRLARVVPSPVTSGRPAGIALWR